MKISTLYKIVFSFFLFCQFSFAQVDVVYNNLVWSDEFSTNGAVNSSNWFHQTQLPAGGSWFNNEVQHYTNQLSNSFVDGGYLNIVAKKEPYTDQGVSKQYTSARLNSKFAFKYGRVDVRAKLPLDSGTWPAIWMLGKNVNEPGGYFAATYGTTDWPACGETDIMEHGIFPSQSINYIQSTLHTPSSFGGSVNNGGINASDLANNYHVYSLNWSPFEMSFLLDGVVFYTYNPAIKDATTWPFDKEQFILLNVALGGTAGTINPNYTQSSMLVDYVRVYQNTLVDTQAPTSFTASIGAVTYNSVELLLNANDNSSTIAYNITYGATTISVGGTSGVQKSVVINGLSPSTNYVFSITASDLSGNNYINNPIVINATTPAIPTVNTECLGTSTISTQGTFSTGYRYGFQTTGTDVKITFELLDTDRSDVVAYLWKQSPFSEVQMTKVTGNIFTKTITGQTVGSTINYAVKFAYAGGMSVTKYFSYVVGNTCSLGMEVSSQIEQLAYPNPVDDLLYLQLSEVQSKIILSDVLGKIHIQELVNSDQTIDMSSFKPGIYFLRVENSNGVKNLKIIKK